ncbi:putative flavin-containing monoamine oxidase A [Symbiodinium microadriaticum]|uniref:monoamine oxidase n=1 Tax=Symbiodinium microadriaticum TaxID=2951 RepID=A0A1Q9F1U0_SYMMI|nr:putative flavin-containing monoamine oxidase A [Symbiodinium microadriaticum]
MRRWPFVSFLAGAAVLAGRALAAHDQLDADVIIIGAGQAGMAAAYQLRKRGLTVRVLEATDHVGGHTRNIDVATGKMDVETDDVIEVGGTWLSPAHSAALELCRELGIEVYNASFVPDLEVSSGPKEEMPWWYWGSDYPTEQRHRLKRSIVHTSTGRHFYTTASDLQAAFPSQSAASLKRVGEFIDGKAAGISDRCWLASGVSRAWREADADTTWGALGGKLEGKDAEQVLRNCIHGKNAQEPEAVSFLYNLLSFKGCNSKGADSQYRVRGGTQAIPLQIAAKLGNSVLLGHEVRSIKADGGDVEIQVHGGKSFRARAAILTGPPPAILGISFSPPLGGVDAQWLQRMPMGTSLKLAAIYKEGPWWRELGLQGEILSTLLPPKLSLPAPDTDLPLFVQCMDHSPYSQRIGVIVCFVEGRQNFHFLQMSQNDQQERFVEFLAMSFNSSKAKTFKPSFVAHNWADQPFARGAYTGFFSPGVMSVPEFWTAFQQMEKLPNIFLAGSDYHIGFGNGYIEGALRDGESAARRVADRLQRVMHV